MGMTMETPKEQEVIAFPFSPYDAQMEILEDSHRYKVIVAGRRTGKSVLAFNHMIKEACLNKGYYYYVFPTIKQAKEIIWDQILPEFLPMNVVAKLNNSELKITLKNGSWIKLFGAENKESLRGGKLNGLVFDEFADIDPECWNTILRPALTDKKGWCWFVGTPKGHNHFYEVYIRDFEKHDAKYRNEKGVCPEPNGNWKSWLLHSIDNPYLDPEEIEEARQTMSPEQFRQEYEASFETFSGLIYKELEPRHFIQTPKLDSRWNYYVGIDTGRHTGISFVAIDFNNVAYVYDEIYDHDSTVKEIAFNIRTILKNHNIDFNRTQFIIDSASQVKREYQAELGRVPLDSQKDVLNSIETIRRLLIGNGLYFDDVRCPAHSSEHKAYRWMDKPSPLPKPRKTMDHTVNALQYVLNSTFVTKAYDRELAERNKPITYENFKKLSPLDPKYSEYEDQLGIRSNGAYAGRPTSRNHTGNNPVTGYN